MASHISIGRRALTVLAVLALAAALGGCDRSEEQDRAARDDKSFDVGAMTWSPSALADAAPGLVGWRSTNQGGTLEVLTASEESAVIWESPKGEAAPLCQLMAVDPRAQRMVGELYGDRNEGAAPQHVVIFEPDGTVRDMPLPDGFEGVSDVAFCDAGIVVVANHATVETYETSLGLVEPGGGWTPLELAGSIPEHQFIESVAVLPGSLIGLVMKIPGDIGDRDDDLLVLGALEGSTLTVETAPYYDDSLPYARPLGDAPGVVYARLWPVVDGVRKPSIVRAEWTGTEWIETSVLGGDSFGVGPETGQTVEQHPSGGYWIKDAQPYDHAEGSELLLLRPEEQQPTRMYTNMSGVSWFTWLVGE
jgi:hypothetical protein